MTKTNSSYFYAEGDRVFVNDGAGVKECIVQAIEHISDIYDRFVLMSVDKEIIHLLVNAFTTEEVIFPDKASALQNASVSKT